MSRDLPYVVEQWSEDERRVTRTIAAADDVEVARAAFARAVRLSWGTPITLRHGPKLLVARWTETRRRARQSMRTLAQ